MKGYLAVAAFIIALGLAGNDDLEQAQSAHKSMCERNPKAEFCGDEIK